MQATYGRSAEYKYVIFFQRNHIAVTGKEGPGFLKLFLAGKNHHMLDACTHKGCAKIVSFAMVCMGCAKAVCTQCIRVVFDAADAERMFCPHCNSVNTAYPRSRLRTNISDDDFDEVKRMHRKKNKAPCTVCKKKLDKSFMCTCYEAPHYCSEECRNAHWPAHRPFCSAASKRWMDEGFKKKLASMRCTLRAVILPHYKAEE